jgi:hypothetical protein
MEVLVLEVAMLQSRHFWLERTNTIPHVRTPLYHRNAPHAIQSWAWGHGLRHVARHMIAMFCAPLHGAVVLPSQPLSAELICSSGVTCESSGVT